MRLSLRGGFVGAAAVVALGAWPATATASGSTVHTTGTNWYVCFNAEYTDTVLIEDTYSRTVTDKFVVTSVDVLTNTVTGKTLRFVSHYTVTFDEFGAPTLQGPSILDLAEPDPNIYYLKGNAVLGETPGGYAAFKGADQVIDVCALLRA